MGEYQMNSAESGTDSRQHLEEVATETLGTFASIAEKAELHLKAEQTSGADALASINTLTSGEAVQNLGRSLDKQRWLPSPGKHRTSCNSGIK